MKWCCLPFQSHKENASGSRGFAIAFGKRETGENECILQFRSVNQGEEKSVSSAVPLSLMEEIRIQYCPWCGRELMKWYKKNF